MAEYITYCIYLFLAGDSLRNASIREIIFRQEIQLLSTLSQQPISKRVRPIRPDW